MSICLLRFQLRTPEYFSKIFFSIYLLELHPKLIEFLQPIGLKFDWPYIFFRNPYICFPVTQDTYHHNDSLFIDSSNGGLSGGLPISTCNNVYSLRSSFDVNLYFSSIFFMPSVFHLDRHVRKSSYLKMKNWKLELHKHTSHCAKMPLSTMLATSKNVLFPGHNHLLTTSTDDPTLWLSPKLQRGW